MKSVDVKIEERKEILKQLVEAEKKYFEITKSIDNHSESAVELEEQERKFIADFLENISEPTLEKISEAIEKEGIGISPLGLGGILQNIKPEKNGDLRTAILEYLEAQEHNEEFFELDVFKLPGGIDSERALETCGNACARLGMEIDELPEGVLYDTDFLYDYLLYQTPEDLRIKEHSDEYYMRHVNIINNAQEQLDRKSKTSPLQQREEKLSSLEAEEKTISEAEALIDQQKEGQDIGEE